MANTNDLVEKLARRVAYLERLVLVLVASSPPDVDGPPFDDLLYMLHRYTGDDDRLRRDPEFFHFVERLASRRSSRAGQRLEAVQQSLEEQMRSARADVEDLAQRLQQSSSSLQEDARQRSANLEAQLSDLAAKATALAKEVHSSLITQTLGLDQATIPSQRYLPLRVYLSDADQQKVLSVSRAVTHLASTFGFSIADDFPSESGSWWKKWFVRTKEAVTQPEVVERVKKLERALELQGIHKPQSEVTKNEAEAVAALLKAVENVPSAAVQAGAVLLIKTTDTKGSACVQVRTLSQRELGHLERNQRLLASPHELLESLADYASRQETITIEANGNNDVDSTRTTSSPKRLPPPT